MSLPEFPRRETNWWKIVAVAARYGRQGVSNLLVKCAKIWKKCEKVSKIVEQALNFYERPGANPI